VSVKLNKGNGASFIIVYFTFFLSFCTVYTQEAKGVVVESSADYEYRTERFLQEFVFCLERDLYYATSKEVWAYHFVLLCQRVHRLCCYAWHCER
jgi:hypothetical protein